MVDYVYFLSYKISHPLDWIILIIEEGIKFSASLSLLSEPENNVF